MNLEAHLSLIVPDQPAPTLVYSGTLVCSQQGCIEWIDEALLRLLALPMKAWQGVAFDEVFVPDVANPALPPWPRSGCEPWNAVVRGRAGRVQVRVTPVPLELCADGRQICSLVAFDSYTIDRMAAVHVRLRSTIGAVVAGFAHEVRNPLASILTLTELTIRELRSSYLPHDALLRIPSLVTRIERIIRQTLEYGRPPKPIPRVFGVGYLVRSSLRLVQPRFPGVSFTIEGPMDAPVWVDMQQAEQIICNLLQNAAEAEATTVRISCTTDAEREITTLRIADDGTGVPDDLLVQIFEPFRTSKATGTGLGLAIARDLARLNGGDVEVVKTSPSGTQFEVVWQTGRLDNSGGDQPTATTSGT